MSKGQNETETAKATHADVAFAIPDFNPLFACRQDYPADTISNQ
jgi:hypothetical protein